MGTAIPRLTDHLIARPAGLQQLDRWAPVTLVRGMHGYGKTTLVGAWLRAQPSVRILWFTATSATDAVEEIVQELRRRLGVTGTPMGDSAATADPGEATSRPPVQQRTVIVIDNAHRVRDVDVLRWLIAVLQQRHDLHLILCSRGPHPLQTLADGRIEIVTITGDQLLFTAEDTAELARRLNLTLSPAQLGELHAEFGGWPAAIGLVFGEMDADATEPPLTRAQRYLRDSVLPGIVSVQVLKATMRFAIAERLTHRLIRDLADELDPDELIAMIEGSGLSEPRHRSEDVELVLPNFIRRVLREAYTARYPDEARRLHRRMAAWFAAQHGPDHHLFALGHAVAAGDWSQLDALWAARGLTLAADRPDAVLAVLTAVPRSVLARRPAMTVIHRALATIAARAADDSGDRWLAGHREYAQASAAVAVRGLADLPLPDRLIIGTGYLLSLRMASRLEEADRVGAELGDELAQCHPGGDQPGDQLAWFHLQRAITDTLRLRPDGALHSAGLSWRHRDPAASFIGAAAAANLALTHAVGGRHRPARAWLARHAGSADHGSWTYRVGAASGRIATGLLALDRLEPLPHQLDDDLSVTELWPYAAFLRAQHDLLYRPPLAALATLDHACQTHQDQDSEAATVLLTRARADLLIANGQAQRAQTLAAGVGLEQHPSLAVPLAWISLLAGRAAAARRVCARAVWLKATNDRDRIELLLIEAAAAYRLDERDASAELTGQALALRRHSGVLRPFALLSRATRDALLENAGERLGGRAGERLTQVKSPYPQVLMLVNLTPREQQLAALLARTGSRDQIAGELFLSVNTVKKQLNTLYRKLEATTRAEALDRLERLGLND